MNFIDNFYFVITFHLLKFILFGFPSPYRYNFSFMSLTAFYYYLYFNLMTFIISSHVIYNL